jgi:preprotein translocase subunit YajC
MMMTQAIQNALAWAAQQTAPAGTSPAGQQAPFNPMIMMIVVIMVMFYFLIMRPQKKAQKQRQEQLDSLAKGDKVITTGGLHGTVEEVSGDKTMVTLNVAPKISLKFSRSAIGTVTKRKAGADDNAEASK